MNVQGGSRGLLRTALKGAAASTQTIPIRSVIVDALDEEAKRFYAGFDFEPYPADGLRMWLLMKDLIASLKAETKKLQPKLILQSDTALGA
jgi:hypothetical protein